MWSRRGYRRLFAASTVSRWGDTFNTVALAIVAFRVSGSGLGVTGVVVAEILPVLVFGPIAGLVVDRLRRVRVMVAADLWRLALAATLPFVAHDLSALYAVAFALSAGAVFFNPAAQSLLPGVVDDDELVAANSGLWSAAVVSQIILAPVAGLLVAWAGVAPAFLLNATSFAASAALLTRLDEPVTVAAAGRVERWSTRLWEGLALLSGDPLLRLLAGSQLVAALSAGATSALLVVLAERHYDAGPAGFGWLLSAIGLGAAAGPLLLRRVADPRHPRYIFGPFALRGIVDLVLAATRALPIAAGALVAYGVGTSTGAVTFNSLLQAETPAHARGRVFAGFDMLWQIGRLTSLGIGGLAADALGIEAVYLLGGLLLLAAGGLGFARLPATLLARR